MARRAINKQHNTNHRINTIINILKHDYKIDFRIVFETSNETECYRHERELIKKYGRRNSNIDGLLTNLTDGGAGPDGYRHPEWVKKLRSKNILGKNNPMYGQKHSDESRRLISQTRKELFASGDITPTRHSDAHKKSLKLNNPGGRALSRPIYAIDAMGQICHTFISLSDAARFFGDAKKRTNISICAVKYKNRKSCDYYWRYVDEFIEGENFLELKRTIRIDKGKKRKLTS